MASSFLNRKAEEAKKRKEEESTSGGSTNRASSFLNRKAEETAAKNGAGNYTTYEANEEAARRNDRTGSKQDSTSGTATASSVQQKPRAAVSQLVNKYQNMAQDMNTEYQVSKANRKTETARAGVMDAAKRNSLYQSAMSAAQTERAQAATQQREEEQANAKKNAQLKKEAQARRMGVSIPEEEKVYPSGTVRTNDQSRVGDAFQSIGLSTLGSAVYAVDNVKQIAANQEAYEQTDIQERLADAYSNLNIVAGEYGRSSDEYAAALEEYERIKADINTFKSDPARVVPSDTLGSRMLQTAQEKQAESMEGLTGVWRDLAEAGYSVADNLTLAALSGFNPAVTTALMSAKAGVGRSYELAQQGVSAGQALARGIAAGGIEYLTERMGIDNLFNMVKYGQGNVLLSILQQGGIEGAEEIASYLLNFGADLLANDPNAEFDFKEMLRSGQLGAVSGLMFGVGGTAINALGNYSASADAQTNAEQAAVEEAIELIRQGLDENGEYQAPTVARENATGAENAQVESPVSATENAQERTFAPEAKTASRDSESRQAEHTEENTVRDAETVVQDLRTVSRAATTLGENGSSALRAVYSDESVNSEYSAENVIQGFTALYNQAQGKKLSATAQARANTMPDIVKSMAESAGLEDARRAKQAVYFGEKSGIVRDENLKKANLSYKTTRQLDALGKALGVQVKFTDSITDDAGNRAFGNYKDGVISVALDSESPVQSVVVHEAVHRLREVNSSSYEALSRFVLEHMSESRYEWNTRYTGELYGDGNVDAVSEEVVADAFGTILNDSGLLEQFAREHTTVLQRIADSIRDTIRKVNKAVSMEDLQLTDSEKRRFSDLANELAGMEKTMRNALRTVESQSANKNTATAGGGKVKYSIKVNGNYLYVQADRQVLFGDDSSKWGKQIERFINEKIRNGEDVLFPTSDGHILALTERSAYKLSDRHRSQIQKEARELLSDKEYSLKGKIAGHIDEIIQVGVFDEYRSDLNNAHENDIGEDGFNYFTAYFKDADDSYYRVRFSSGLNENSETVYSIGNIQKRRLPSRVGSSGETGALSGTRKSSFDNNDTTKESKSQAEKSPMQIAYEQAQAKSKSKFKLAAPAEESGDLVALHNLTEDKLLGDLRLGGFPMPSIAVTKASIPHTDFGNITLVMDKNSISQMPVNMFEAKPQRAVGFDEVLTAVIPSDSSAQLREGLEQAGVPVVEYEAGNESDRLAKVNSVENAKFSRSNKAALEEFIQKYGEAPEATEKAAMALLKENEQLREVNEGLKAQFKRTELKKVDKRRLNSLTRQLLKDYNSSVDIDDARAALDGLYTYLANGENGDSAVWESAYERAYAVAEIILENSSVTNDAMYREYEALRKDIKNTAISIDPDYVHDLGYENLAEFKKNNRGRIRLDKNGIPIDTLYQSLVADYPGLFDAEVWNPADQLGHIEAVLNSLEPKTENPYAANLEDASSWLANDIIERFYELPQAKPTYADKTQQKLDWEKIRGQHKLDSQKARYEAKLEQKNRTIRDTVTAERMAAGRELAEQKREYQGKLDSQKARYEAELDETIRNMIDDSRARVQNAILAERMAAGRELNKQKQKYRERAAKADEKKKTRVLRERIQKHTSELSRKLLNPSDKAHIPEQLRKPVAQLLKAIDLESKGGKATARTLAFDELRRAYRDILQNESSQVTVDPDMEANLDQLMALKDTRIAEMSSNDLQTVWKVLKSMEYSISTAGKTLASSKYERTAQWADALKEDTKTRKTRKGKLAEVQLDVETPYTFFSQYGEAGKAVYRMLRDAQDSQTVMTNEVTAQVQEIVDEKTVNVLRREAHRFTTEGGKELTLTTAQIMDIYLLSKRQQALNHLLGGGIVQPDVKAKGAKAERGTSPVQLSQNDLNEITGTLTAEQKTIADKLQALTASTLAEYGNSASMKVYGYRKFTGLDYWPIRSAGESLHYNAEGSGKNARSIKNIGLAKQVNHHANNPLNVGSVFDVLSEHAGNMIDYAAWLGPMEDANRLFNYRYQTEDGDAYVKSLLDRVGGKKAQAYWKNLMEDIQNGIKARNDSNMDRVLSKMVGNVKGARVGANLRVVIQQPTAFFRAMDTLSPLAMAEGMRMRGGWKKALQYSPIAQKKALGGFDISSPAQMNDILYGTSSKMQKFNGAMGWGAEKADAFTWGKLWNACEVQTAWNRNDLAPGTDEFYSAVNDLFTEVIDSSQVVDGVLQRSQAMRSSSDTMKQATAFMGEPIMSLNMMMRAVDNLRMETDSSKRGKALRGLGRAAASLAVTDIVNALAQSLIDAARDDDDDPYWEKFWRAFTGFDKDSENTALETIYSAWLEGNLLSNMSTIGRMPVAKDLISIAQGYTVDRADMDAVDDIIGATRTLMNAVKGESNRTMAYAVENFAKKVGAVFGISAPNLLRDVWGITRSVAQETGNIPLMYEMEKAIYKLDSSSNSTRFAEILYLAQQNDQESYDHILADMAENGIDVNSIRKKISNYIKNDNFAKEETQSLTVPQFSAYSSGVENEIQRLVEKTGDTSVSPGNAPKSFPVDGVEIELTQEEYDEYSTVRYNTYGELVGKLLKAKDYQQMDDEAKVKAVRVAASYANEVAKSKAVKAYSVASWVEDAQDAQKNYSISAAQFVCLRSKTSGMKSLKDRNGDTIENSKSLLIMEAVYDTPGLNEKQRKAMFEYLGAGKKVQGYNKTLVKEKLAKMRKQAK